MVYRCDDAAAAAASTLYRLIARPHAVQRCNIYVLGVGDEFIMFHANVK